MQTCAHIAQQVEHFHGKEGVIGSNPIVGYTISKELKMAQIVTLECESCGERNYTTTKTKKMIQERTKLELKKYCSRERGHFKHKEVK